MRDCRTTKATSSSYLDEISDIVEVATYSLRRPCSCLVVFLLLAQFERYECSKW